MRDAQYWAASVLGRVVCDVLGRSVDYIKFHNGTSISGKWDAGYAMGKTYSIANFRAAARAVTSARKPRSNPMAQGDDMIIMSGSGGPGPFGCQNLGILSGGIFCWQDPGEWKTHHEYEYNNNRHSLVWVNQWTWNNLDMQSKQLRGVGDDGVTRIPAEAPPPG